MSYLIKPLVIILFAFALVPITAYSNTFIPNSFNDIVDSNPGDGLCLTSTNVCTLRAAIQESNSLQGPHTILLGVGTYRISISGINDDNSLTGDLDIRTDITIAGKGAAKTIINGSDRDRILDIKDAIVNLKDLSITNGTVTILDENGTPGPGGLGGGILVFLGTLNLDNVWVHDNIAVGMGGGIFSLLSKVNAQHSMLYRNQSSVGAGIAVLNGDTTLNESFIFGHPNTSSTPSTFINSAGTFLGGGIFNFGNLTITKSILNQNTAEVDGGAIYHGFGKLLISNSTIANNVAKRNGGAIYYRMGEIGKTGAFDNDPHLANVSIVNNSAFAIDQSALDPLPAFVPDFTQFPEFNGNGFIPTIDFTIPEGEQEGGIGGGGLFVAGQLGQEQAKVFLSVANSIVANNYGNTTKTILDDCKVSSDGGVRSFGHNADSDSTLGCNFTHVNDLTTGIDLKLVALNVSNLTNPNFTQSQFNKLIPHTQLIASDSPLRNAGNDAHCPDDDQRGQTRPVIGCDIGAYEFLPPVASPMQFVVKPGDVIDSAFMISDPANKAVTFEIISPPAQGTIAQPNTSAVSNWSYTANVTASGNDQFTYRACFSPAGECSNTATIGFKIITEPVVETVSIDIVSDIGGNASGIDIVNEAELIAGLEDTDYTFPLGAIFFSVDNIPVSTAVSSESLVVKLQLPVATEIPDDAVVRKLDNTGNWRTLASSPSITESTGVIDPVNKTITLTLLDNDVFDSNPADGVIRDPVALAIPDELQSKATKDSDDKSSGSLNILSILFLMLIVSIRARRSAVRYARS